MFYLILGAAGLVTLLLSFYIIARIRKLGWIRQSGKRTSWILACLLAVGVIGGLFIVFNVTTVIVIVLHIALDLALSDLLGGIRCKVRKRTPRYGVRYLIALVILTGYLGAGWFMAHHVFATRYTFTTEKDLGENVRIAVISDSHLGITLDGAGFTRQMKRIQAEDPDLLVIVGDFVDDDSDQADMLQACEALGALQTKYGVYFVFGNHDDGYMRYRNFSSSDLRQALTDNGVKILEDEAILIDERFYLIGRRDRTSRNRAAAPALMEELDGSKYTVMLDHQPNDYAGEAASGVDLVLSGHTHGGHIFPAGLIGIWTGANDRTYGTEVRDRTTFVVTSGISGWAIPFKTFAISEYVIIDITTE